MSSPAERRFQAHERAFELLQSLPEQVREWTLCQEAVRAYVEAGEPPYPSDFWGRGLGDHQRLPLWHLLGQALSAGGKPTACAIAVLEAIRTSVKAECLVGSGALR